MIRKKAILGLAGLGLLASGLGREYYIRKRIKEDIEQASEGKNKKLNFDKVRRLNPYITVEELKNPFTGKIEKRIARKSSSKIFPALGLAGGAALLGLGYLRHRNLSRGSYDGGVYHYDF